MDKGPFRSNPPEADADLVRLAAEGRQRILEAGAGHDAAEREAAEENRERYVRAALGRHYGARVVQTVAVVLIVAGLLTIGVLLGVANGWRNGNLPGSSDALISGGAMLFVICFIGGMALLLSEPKASRARVAAERAWASSLPFALVGYFEVLAATPEDRCRLVMDLAWDGVVPSLEIVQGILGVIDTDAQVLSTGDWMVRTIRSGSISGDTLRSSSGSDGGGLCNHRYVAYVHNLVDKVLLPLHRSHALARVSLTREV